MLIVLVAVAAAVAQYSTVALLLKNDSRRD
jgi:hypothetical protein